MNILLINHYAGSPRHGMEYRPYYLAKEWIKLGHKVTIIAASFSHLRTVQPQMKRDAGESEEEIDGLRYLWLKTPEYLGNGMARLLNMIVFVWRLLGQKPSLVSIDRYDLVIASSPHPFIIFGAAKIARRSKAKLFFEVRDLWPLTLKEIGAISSYHPFMVLMKYVEIYAYRVADRVVSLLPKANSYMQEHGMAPNKFVYIPNGIDTDEWQSENIKLPDPHQEIFDRLRRKGKFVIGYTGEHGPANALNNLIEAAILLKDYDISIILVGRGPEKNELQQKVAELKLSNVVFLPPVSKRFIPALLRSMDVLYVGSQRTSLYRFGISFNKLFDYMMAEKPVIFAVEAGNDIVAESESGVSIPPEHPGELAQALTKLMNMTPNERKYMGMKGREYVLAHHDYRVLANRYLE